MKSDRPDSVQLSTMANSRRIAALRTSVLCLLVALAAGGYLIRFGRADRVVNAGVSLVATVATAGMVCNAVTIYRER
jgi:hypothetical protein